MSKSNKYGYSGVDIPTQAFKANVGKFDPSEINELVQEDEWTQYGQLELIETQTYSSAVTAIDFTSIQESTYNVHFMTCSQMNAAVDNIHTMNIRLYESGTLETGGVYYSARQNAGLHPTVGFNENRSTSANKIALQYGSGTATGESESAYIYFYNLGDSSNYSFVSWHSVGLNNDAYFVSAFGSGALPQASQVDGIRLLTNSNNYSDFKVSLYGIRYA